MDIARLGIEVSQRGARETASALHNVSQAGKTADASFTDLAKRIAGFTTAADLAVRGARSLIRGVKDLAAESVTLAAGFEKSRITWGVLVGDMEKGEAIFEKLRQFAAATPLSFESVESAAQTLKGFGTSAENLIPTLSRLGDLSRGDSSALGRLALVFGQVQAQGRAMTQDLYQFVNAGIPIFNILSQSMGVSAGKIKELTAEGRIGFDEINAAIIKATSSGGQFFGMMEKTAQTTSGKWSTALDNMKGILADIGEKALPLINAGLDAFNKKIEESNSTENILTVLGTKGSRGDIDTAVLDAKQRLNEEESKLIGLWGDHLRRQQTAVERARALVSELGQIAMARGRIASSKAGPQNDSVDQIDFTQFRDYPAESGSYYNAEEAERYRQSLVNAYSAMREMDDYAQGVGGQAIYEKFVKDRAAAEQLNEEVKRFNEYLVNGVSYSALDSFKTLGESARDGAISVRDLGNAFANFGKRVLDMLPTMFLQAGLTRILAGDIGTGMMLLGMAASTSFVSGYTTINAHGNAYGAGGLMAFAHGGTFTNSIVNKPTLFRFASGAGVMGEAGPEAIMPLTRTSSGDLGVRSTGGGVTVQVNNYSGASIETGETTGTNGERVITLLINKVKSEFASGGFDSAVKAQAVRAGGVRR